MRKNENLYSIKNKNRPKSSFHALQMLVFIKKDPLALHHAKQGDHLYTIKTRIFLLFNGRVFHPFVRAFQCGCMTSGDVGDGGFGWFLPQDFEIPGGNQIRIVRV